MVRLVAAGVLLVLWVGPVCGETIECISRAPDGSTANGASFVSAVSADGSVVAYASDATNLVADDQNGMTDVFVYARRTGTTERVSVGGDGRGGDGLSAGVALSGDGRFVAFASVASNLVPGDSNGVADVFVRDRELGTTERVSVGAAGAQADGTSFGHVSISADGRFVAFRSFAANLVADDTNGATDVFVRDRQADTTERVSVGVHGQGAGMSFWPSLSADGDSVAFASAADNLVPNDQNRAIDVFVRHRSGGTTERMSIADPDREPTSASIGFPMLSGDGAVVAFSSSARELLPDGEDTKGKVDLFVRMRAEAEPTRVSIAADGAEADGASVEGALSRDGRMVVFYSAATNLVDGDTNAVTDVFARDRESGRLSRLVAGDAATYLSGAAVSATGDVVTVYGEAANLVDGDTNGVSDVFVWQR